ncbi:uncharacterized protein LOC122045017 [Zingiber officinale]|uniref:PWWP domain-containing protein n=1 Tax=Zingiber officinale TaxID=94328 RepID=A0A8J5HB27_ZINOF|nr:uncharacterized protein LOC122045017 [Zingiber officinale]KAG6523148.1 hypothetical protein ZIOFF_013001 [Zingiber officinale]
MDSETKAGDGVLDLNFVAGEQPETLTGGPADLGSGVPEIGVKEDEEVEEVSGDHDTEISALAEVGKVAAEVEDTEADRDVVDEKSKETVIDEDESARASGSSAKRKKGRRRKSAVVRDEYDSRSRAFQDENKTVFAVSDIVWGKVRSHPWWPAQIFDPSDASKMASNNRKKDHYLVAYFGDKTFAWCDDSQLKPFQKHFLQLENQNSMEAFVTAKDDALQEVSRRVDLGMACHCFMDRSYASLMNSKFENAGVRERTPSYPVNKSWIANSFDPLRLIDSIEAFARSPNGRIDKLELVILKSQLKAIYRLKGYSELPTFVIGAGLEDNIEVSVSVENKSGQKTAVDPSKPIFADNASRKTKSRDKGSSVGKEKHDSTSKRKISGKEVGGSSSPTFSDDAFRKTKSRDKGGSVGKEKQDSQSKKKRSDSNVADRSNPTSKTKSKERGSSVGKEKQIPPLKGKRSDKEFTHPSSDDDLRKTKSVSSRSSVGTEKHVVERGRKRKSLSKLIEESSDDGKDACEMNASHSSHRNQELEDFDVDDIGKGKEKKLDALGDFVTKSQTSSSKQQSKFGELMRRVAGQMTGSPPMLKPNGETIRKSSSKVTRRKRGRSAILKQKKTVIEIESDSNGHSSDEMHPEDTAISEDEKFASSGQDTEGEPQIKKQNKKQSAGDPTVSLPLGRMPDTYSEGNSLDPSNRSSEFSPKSSLPVEAEPNTIVLVHEDNGATSDEMHVDAHG